MKLRIFGSTRKTKEYYEQSKALNALLDDAINIQDFLERVCLVNSYKASSYESLLLMQEACLRSKNLEKELGISADFFTFLKNNEYLFSFFKELSLEKKSIDDLKNNDYYANYNEHLEILKEVFDHYLALLKKNNLHDDLSLVKDYSINFDFIDEYDVIMYNLEGFLSKFEEDLFLQISKYKEVILCFRVSRFNYEYFSKFDFLSEVNLEIGFYYEVSLNQKKILKKDKIYTQNSKVKVKSFEIRSLQCAFVMDEVSNFLREGLKPENIVIITPDENFCDLLRLFDKNNMFNFASGINIKESLFYQKLKILYNAANSESFYYQKQEDYFLNEDTIFDYYNTFLHYLNLDFEYFKSQFDQQFNFEQFENLIIQFLENEKQELISIVQKELCFIKDLLKNQSLKFKELLQLFFIHISNLTLSYVGGGKITVMGLLESRGLHFDGVVIVDFNEDVIPKRSINELFLNNEVRKKAGLISYERRENLQRFYYENLIKNAKKVSISYVENEEQRKSRFLDDLDIKYFYEKPNSKTYLDALRLNYQSVRLNLEPIKAPILKHNPFEKPLSFTRFNLLQNQKRTYYYRYILNLKEARALSYENNFKNEGNFIHKILEIYYKENLKNYFDCDIFNKLLQRESLRYGIGDLELEILKIRFENFYKNEQKHFDLGYKVDKLELPISKVLNFKQESIELIGVIDRIDRNNKGENFIIDYKSGKIPTDSYQLAFYQALYDHNAQAFFYDLKRMKFVKEKAKSLPDLFESLKELLDESKEEIEFENKKDGYCPYRLIYKKEVK